VQLAGIVNVTPDSFFDGGRHAEPIAFGLQLLEEGADQLDIGGESTRPGSRAVSVDEELGRILGPIAALSRHAPVSVDTQKPEVAVRALAAGATVVNDVNGLRAPGMLEVVAAAGAGAVIMHMRGNPETMQADTHYDDVVVEVREFLRARIAAARAAGIRHIWADPGIGFGKSAAQCAELLRRLGELDVGAPLYIGASRKSFIGALAGVPDAQDRLPGSLAAAAASLRHADILRVHDVAATRQFLTVLDASWAS
jgi:dihydropteroate synthase